MTTTTGETITELTSTTRDPAKALELKDKGNEAFKKNDFDQAIEYYTKAIEYDDSNEVFYSNRAQAYIKTECYGLAIQDATKAIELKPSFTKAYYRRATAENAIFKHKEALKDLRIVLKSNPNDKAAKSFFDACSKIVRRLQFEAAIATEGGQDILATFNLDSVSLEANYDGVALDVDYSEKLEATDAKSQEQPKYKVEMTMEFIKDMIQRFKDGKRIAKRYAYAIVLACLQQFRQDPTLLEISLDDLPEDATITVCGDTHGQFYDVLNLFSKNGFPSEKNLYLFNGDFVDRGSWSTEVALLLYSFKLLYPKYFFLNRGNHETDYMNKVYGFEGECSHKYTEKLFTFFSLSFAALPLASLIGSSYLVMHGGLFSEDEVTLDDIRKINRLQVNASTEKDGIMMELLWADPQKANGRAPNNRGIGIQFGPDVTKNFCERNGLKAIIRSHEVRMGGYEIEHDGRLITVFSAPNYCDVQKNLGAYIVIDKKYEMKFHTFEAVEHPNIPPMAYAGKFGGL